MENLYPIAEVSKKWQVSKKVLRTAVDRGDLAAIKVGRFFFFTDEQLQDYLLRRTLKKSKHGAR